MPVLNDVDANTVLVEVIIGVCSPTHNILSLIVSLSFVYYALLDCHCHC